MKQSLVPAVTGQPRKDFRFLIGFCSRLDLLLTGAAVEDRPAGELQIKTGLGKLPAQLLQ